DLSPPPREDAPDPALDVGRDEATLARPHGPSRPRSLRSVARLARLARLGAGRARALRVGRVSRFLGALLLALRSIRRGPLLGRRGRLGRGARLDLLVGEEADR